MIKTLKLSMAFMTLIIASSTCFAMAKKVSDKKALKSPEIFFFQHADKGSLIKKGKCYQLTLEEPEAVSYFSQAPKQIAGKLTAQKYLMTWKHNQLQHPNAIMHASIHGKHKGISQVVVISQPKYKTASKQMTYYACPFYEEKTLKTGRLNDINLFIDPFHRWPP